eukprot:gnl/TRDRNA2_/TRDRNA2_165035_c0_seq1.p1 gnl/TRDRNA2_/TRDRNA2_165035_c0~~gnl/TRDRNA2_/TRDRNA2_165035_c0_seq1.p1  ORF type:complete len:448 (-),score=69.04 gnl/TRDRNA2_/TRDRNA2_165035_c0_seq1:36-1379(-)
MMLEPPFTEDVLQYDAAKFPFLPHVRRLLHFDACNEKFAEAVELPPLERLHDMICEQRFRDGGGRLRLKRRLPRLLGPLVQDESFLETYHGFIRDFVRPHLAEDYVIYEKSPNLRIHAAGSKSLTAPHKDEDHKHSCCELNFWLPLTAASGSASLWTESAPGRGDFHALHVGYGDVVRFYGNQCLHFTHDNTTDTTRVSLDFRLVRFRDFARAGIPEDGTLDAAGRWALFRFYEVMGPDGPISREDWPDIVATASAMDAEVPRSIPPTASSPAGEGFVQADQESQRPRSTSREHRLRCSEKFGGSERAARLGCARCAWLANRTSLEQALTYVDPAGVEVPWIAEAPNPFAPWGLGCILCHAARNGRLGSVRAPSSPFTEFTFGMDAPGLFYNELHRHGNHGKRQQKAQLVKPLDNSACLIQRNDSHEAAAVAAAMHPEVILARTEAM